MLFVNLGIEPYQRAWDLQHHLVKARQCGQMGDILLLLEHEPVITLGRMADEQHVLASIRRLRRSGVTLERVERGGDVTYHGPGQLVGYPILLLRAHDLGVSDYMHALEQVIIRTLAAFGLTAERRAGLIGVWIGERKIAALGARIEQGVTYHGFALNVAPNLAHFGLIIPCGLSGVQITSIQQETGQTPDMALVRQQVVSSFGEVFAIPMQETSLAQLLDSIDQTRASSTPAQGVG